VDFKPDYENKVKNFVSQARDRGYSDDVLKNGFMSRGFPNDFVKKVMRKSLFKQVWFWVLLLGIVCLAVGLALGSMYYLSLDSDSGSTRESTTTSSDDTSYDSDDYSYDYDTEDYDYTVTETEEEEEDDDPTNSPVCGDGQCNIGEYCPDDCGCTSSSDCDSGYYCSSDGTCKSSSDSSSSSGDTDSGSDDDSSTSTVGSSCSTSDECSSSEKCSEGVCVSRESSCVDVIDYLDYLFGYDYFSGYLVYIGDTDNGVDLFLNDGSDTVQITSDESTQVSPSIDDTYVVWNTDEDGSVYLYDYVSGVDYGVIGDGYAPKVDNGYVVWYDDENQVALYDIYDSDADGNSLVGYLSTTENSIDYYPSVYDNYVVWVSVGSDDSGVYLYTISDDSFTKISEDTLTHYFPDINGDYVVWTGSEYILSEYDIYLYQISTGEVVKVSDNGNSFYANTFGDYVSYLTYDDSSNFDVYLYQISTGQTIRITDSSENDAPPFMFDSGFVWAVDDGTEYELSYYDISSDLCLGVCSTEDDCMNDEVCFENYCMYAECETDDYCSTYQYCDTADYGSSYTCLYEEGYCGDDEGCDEGEYCESTRCVTYTQVSCGGSDAFFSLSVGEFVMYEGEVLTLDSITEGVVTLTVNEVTQEVSAESIAEFEEMDVAVWSVSESEAVLGVLCCVDSNEECDVGYLCEDYDCVEDVSYGAYCGDGVCDSTEDEVICAEDCYVYACSNFMDDDGDGTLDVFGGCETTGDGVVDWVCGCDIGDGEGGEANGEFDQGEFMAYDECDTNQYIYGCDTDLSDQSDIGFDSTVYCDSSLGYVYYLPDEGCDNAFDDDEFTCETYEDCDSGFQCTLGSCTEIEDVLCDENFELYVGNRATYGESVIELVEVTNGYTVVVSVDEVDGVILRDETAVVDDLGIGVDTVYARTESSESSAVLNVSCAEGSETYVCSNFIDDDGDGTLDIFGGCDITVDGVVDWVCGCDMGDGEGGDPDGQFNSGEFMSYEACDTTQYIYGCDTNLGDRSDTGFDSTVYCDSSLGYVYYLPDVGCDDAFADSENSCPEIILGSEGRTVTEGDYVSLIVNTRDLDDDRISLSFSEPLLEGSWQTELGDAGEYEIVITAIDGECEVTETWNLVVDTYVECDSYIECDIGQVCVNNICVETADDHGDDLEWNYCSASALPACADGVDNDGDNLIDLEDDDCESLYDYEANCYTDDQCSGVLICEKGDCVTGDGINIFDGLFGGDDDEEESKVVVNEGALANLDLSLGSDDEEGRSFVGFPDDNECSNDDWVWESEYSAIDFPDCLELSSEECQENDYCRYIKYFFGDACRYKADDNDNDGFGYKTDCDETDSSIYPGAEEVADGIDNDCDGYIDCDDPEYSDNCRDDCNSLACYSHVECANEEANYCYDGCCMEYCDAVALAGDNIGAVSKGNNLGGILGGGDSGNQIADGVIDISILGSGGDGSGDGSGDGGSSGKEDTSSYNSKDGDGVINGNDVGNVEKLGANPELDTFDSGDEVVIEANKFTYGDEGTIVVYSEVGCGLYAVGENSECLDSCSSDDDCSSSAACILSGVNQNTCLGCDDPDEGNEYYEKTSVEGVLSSNVYRSGEDVCVDTASLYEYGCITESEHTYVTVSKVYCQAGYMCLDGACIEASCFSDDDCEGDKVCTGNYECIEGSFVGVPGDEGDSENLVLIEETDLSLIGSNSEGRRGGSLQGIGVGGGQDDTSEETTIDCGAYALIDESTCYTSCDTNDECSSNAGCVNYDGSEYFGECIICSYPEKADEPLDVTSGEGVGTNGLYYSGESHCQDDSIVYRTHCFDSTNGHKHVAFTTPDCGDGYSCSEGACVVDGGDCESCSAGTYCYEGSCVSCYENSHCSAVAGKTGNAYCSSEYQCVKCTSSDHCGVAQSCTDNECVSNVVTTNKLSRAAGEDVGFFGKIFNWVGGLF
jgi:hypothetical protein